MIDRIIDGSLTKRMLVSPMFSHAKRNWEKVKGKQFVDSTNSVLSMGMMSRFLSPFFRNDVRPLNLTTAPPMLPPSPWCPYPYPFMYQQPTSQLPSCSLMTEHTPSGSAQSSVKESNQQKAQSDGTMEVYA